MVYRENTYASQFTFRLNINYVWDFLAKYDYKAYHELDVQKIAELTEDEVNLVNILDHSTLSIQTILKKHIQKAYKERNA